MPGLKFLSGFSTAKGELVRAILFPKPLGFKFYQDAMKFILFLACVAFFGMAYSVYSYIRLKVRISISSVLFSYLLVKTYVLGA